jgi:coenzyme F420-0:L-glutamate ligase/coenzyme F420-1:gamma-L-glutamate ligase
MTVPLAIDELDRAKPEMLTQWMRERRSIRRYRAEPLPPGLVERLIDAARFAPSAHNRQPWRFAVLQDAEPKARLAAAMGARLREDRLADGDDADAIEQDVARSHARITSAPALIAACFTMADMDVYADARRAAAERQMAVQGTAMAVQNLLLVAHAEGLGACWMCAPLFCPETVTTALDLPADWEPQALITLGYPAAPGRRRDRRAIAEILLP